MDERERARIRAAIDAAEGGGGVPPASDEQLRHLLAGSRTIAVVGASPNLTAPRTASCSPFNLLAGASSQSTLPQTHWPMELPDSPAIRTLPPQQHHFQTGNASTSLMSFAVQKIAPP